MLDNKIRYLQIAFNGDLYSVYRVLPNIPQSDRIFIEAGTPFIKRYGMQGISEISRLWNGIIVADLKTMDGAAGEVVFANMAGAKAATVLGSASIETLNFFISACKKFDMIAMVDMMNVEDPLRVLIKLKDKPDVIILHKGRDEESTRGKVIQYRHVNRIRSKFDCLISAAGGVDLREARSAIFNGANIVVVNIVDENESWTGISSKSEVTSIVNEFLKTIE